MPLDEDIKKTQVPKKSVLYFWNSQALLLKESTDTAEHQHYALQIAIGINKPFQLNSAGNQEHYRAAIVASNQPHQLTGMGDRQVVLLIDPETDIARQLEQTYLQDEKIHSIDYARLAGLTFSLEEHALKGSPCFEIKSLLDGIMATLLESQNLPGEIDPRVEKLLDYLDQLPLKMVSLKSLSSYIGLSEGRLIHLFKEETGVPIRRYLLWLRLIESIKAVLGGSSLTVAAHETGFSDSAHLSRTFKKMFGMIPKEILKNSRFVQAIFCQS